MKFTGLVQSSVLQSWDQFYCFKSIHSSRTLILLLHSDVLLLSNSIFYLLLLSFPSHHPASPPSPPPPTMHQYRSPYRNLLSCSPSLRQHERQKHSPASQRSFPHQTPELQDADGQARVRAGVTYKVQYPQRPLVGGCL